MSTLLPILWPALSANNFVMQIMHLRQTLYVGLSCIRVSNPVALAADLHWPMSLGVFNHCLLSVDCKHLELFINIKTLSIQLAACSDVGASDSRSLQCTGASKYHAQAVRDVVRLVSGTDSLLNCILHLRKQRHAGSVP